MPAQWTGELVGKMHNNRVSSQELAAKIGCSTKWLSMVLNGHCSPKGAEQRFNAALDELIKEREEENAKEDRYVSETAGADVGAWARSDDPCQADGYDPPADQ